LGFSKERPSVVLDRRVHSRRSASPRSAFGSPLPRATSFRPRGFPPPRRLSPLRPRRDVALACRPWGSSRFRRCARLPRDAFRPSELCSPITATSDSSPSRPVGAVTVRKGDLRERSPETLPPRHWDSLRFRAGGP
jgi:hypothetical protein